MGDVLTIGEIEAKFDSEWVLVGDPVTDDSNSVPSGKVLCHSKDRDEVYRQAVKLRPTRFAVLFVGQVPDDVAIVL